MRSGCAGEVCANREVVTTCIFLPEHACFQEDFASCVCFAGQCQWEQSIELLQCIAQGGPG
jgi:eight-cysteine-cluster-containing protein